MVPLIINPIHTLCSGYLLSISPLQGLLAWVKQLGYKFTQLSKAQNDGKCFYPVTKKIKDGVCTFLNTCSLPRGLAQHPGPGTEYNDICQSNAKAHKANGIVAAEQVKQCKKSKGWPNSTLANCYLYKLLLNSKPLQFQLLKNF